jgi:hypothetical protein
MRTDWIFKVEAKVCHNLYPTMLKEAEVDLLGDMVVMVHQEEVAILVAEAEEIFLISPSTSFLRVNFVARPTIHSSNATSILIQITWEKIEVLMQPTHMELIPIGMLTTKLWIM